MHTENGCKSDKHKCYQAARGATCAASVRAGDPDCLMYVLPPSLFYYFIFYFFFSFFIYFFVFLLLLFVLLPSIFILLFLFMLV